VDNRSVLGYRTARMGAAISTRGVAALEAIERLAAEDLSTQQVIEEVVRRITGVIETDAFFAGATDPDTACASAPAWPTTWPRACAIRSGSTSS
jgi:hypothetical protein